MSPTKAITLRSSSTIKGSSFRTPSYPWINFRRRSKYTRMTTIRNTIFRRKSKPTTKFTKGKLFKKCRKTAKATNNTIELNSTLPAFIEKLLRAPITSSCYLCGLNVTEFPVPDCYNIFQGQDQRFKLKQDHFKVKCIHSKKVRQIKNIYYGPWYRGGCFKRFLDVGIEYNERGCRTFNPIEGKSFASERFAKLEYLLNNVEDGCISSPHASLTPFNRAISLYTHYHVCVCNEKYCNSAIKIYNYNMHINQIIYTYIFLLSIL